MKLPDALVRLVYKTAYPLAHSWWRVRRPRTYGSLLLLWCGPELLLLRTSYHGHWTVPGGGAKAGEMPLDVIIRETAEEIGLRLDAAQLRDLGDVEHFFLHRFDRCRMFEAHVNERPALTLDRREIVHAQWMPAEDALQTNLQPHIRSVLTGRYDAGGASSLTAGGDDRQPSRI